MRTIHPLIIQQIDKKTSKTTRINSNLVKRLIKKLNVKKLSIKQITTILATVISLGWWGEARTVKIVQADNLELRKIADQELVIISGKDRIELQIDNDRVLAQRVEYNRTERQLLLLGNVEYTTRDGDKVQQISGEEVRINLSDNSLDGQDVLISDGQLSIRGEEVERATGQVRATRGYFSLCARCGQKVDDYAFQVKQLILYPADRIIAKEVVLLIAGKPVLWLPIMVLPLNEKERQPRLDVSHGKEGWTAELDLPFAMGDSFMGTQFLRYYQNRPHQFGFGVQLNGYGFSQLDRLQLYTMWVPYKDKREYDIDFRFGVKGRIGGLNETNPLLSAALAPPVYNISIERKDIGSSNKGVINLDMDINANYPLFSVAAVYNNKFVPEGQPPARNLIKHPEVTIDPKSFELWGARIDTRFTVGKYRAPTNPLSRKAKKEQGDLFDGFRLEEQHTISYDKEWIPEDKASSLKFSVANRFTGRYYDNGARTVQLEGSLDLAKKGKFSDWSVSLKGYRSEGTSPFAFDAIGERKVGLPLSLSYSLGNEDIRFGTTYRSDLLGKTEGELNIYTYANKGNLLANAEASYNTTHGKLNSATYRISTKGERVDWSVSGGIRTNYLQPLTVKATFNAASSDIQGPRVSGGYWSLATTYDFESKQRPLSFALDYSFVGEDNLRLSGSESLDPTPFRIRGSHRLAWRGLTLGNSHDFREDRHGNLNWSLSNSSSQSVYWQLGYGGAYDTYRGGFLRPQLNGTLTATGERGKINAAATVNIRGLEQPVTELAAANWSASWQGDRWGVTGQGAYSRYRLGNNGSLVTDRLQLDPVRVGVALGQRPDFYLTAALRGEWTWINGVAQKNPPLSPVLGLTWDRCCWALQSEWDIRNKRFRVAIGLPGQPYTILDKTDKNISYPFTPFF